MATGFVWHERFMWHTPGPTTGTKAMSGAFEPGEYPENANTRRRLKSLLDAYDVTPQLEPLAFTAADDDLLSMFHTQEYIREVAAKSLVPGSDAGDAALVGPGSDEIARLAVGGACAAVNAVADGVVENAYVLCRPPGHHAERDKGRGFCIYANVALSIMSAIDANKLERVAVVDWDVHHGNGTQQAFWDRSDVLTISLHQEMLYPVNSGFVGEVGARAGEGFNINVPLPAGTGGEGYLSAFDEVVEPALRAFKPELIVVACGYDASYFDPLSHMLLISTHFGEMTSRVKDLAKELCGGRVVMAHEGGYSDFYVPFCGAAVVEALSGISSDIKDPFEKTAYVANQKLQPHQHEAVEEAVRGPLQNLLSRTKVTSEG